MAKLSFILNSFLCIVLSACATPYAAPRYEMDSGISAFDGIRDYAAHGDTRVLWIHGMCDHDGRWALERQEILSKAFGVPAAGVYPSRIDPSGATVYSTNGNPRLEVDYLIWSPFSSPYKDRIDYDDPDGFSGRFPYTRAKLNGSLKKTLINRCLIDAVVYSGPNGDPIRDWVKQEVCIGLGGNPVGGKCSMPMTAQAPRTVIVAESLGSKIIFDAIREIWQESSDAQKARLAPQLANVQSIFLLANQIPLLDAADRPAVQAKSLAETSSLGGMLESLSEARDEAVSLKSAVPLPPLQIVAFTDPNDLLSYRLIGDRLFQTDVKVVNVIVSNAPTYLGLFEMPDQAHCGYRWNKHVIGAVVNGYHDGGSKPIQLDLPKDCGLI